MNIKKFFILTFSCFIYHVKCQKPCHILFIIGDDLGYNDFGFSGSKIPTPNIDALGYNGVILHKHYTLHICTPSRSALLTGKYPITMGMQGYPLAAGEPRALPTYVPTMAEQFLKLGYRTHLVGKWHLGHQNTSVTPNGRGFQTHFGYWNGFVGYFSYKIRDQVYYGFDLHRNYEPAREYMGKYATNVFTDEANSIIDKHNSSEPLLLVVSHLAAHTGEQGTALETPTAIQAQWNSNYSCISNTLRKIYADIVNRLDASVGSMVKTLEKKGILNDTIVVFISDNGAPTKGLFANTGSNWPFRGIKNTLWEGAIRNVAVLWSRLLEKKQHVEYNLFHITDWLPTLYAAVGGNISNLGKIDGVNQWPYLTKKDAPVPPRGDICLNIDEKANFSAIMSADGQYKLTCGRYKSIDLKYYDDYYGDDDVCDKPYDVNSVLNSDVNIAIQAVDNSSPLTSETIVALKNELKIKQSSATRGPLPCASNCCLFNLFDDPTETTDIFTKFPNIVKKLNDSLNSCRAELMPQTNKPVDGGSNPACCDFTWHPWLDEDPTKRCYSNASNIYTLFCSIFYNLYNTFFFKLDNLVIPFNK